MPRKAMKESEKAETALSNWMMGEDKLMGDLRMLADRVSQAIRERAGSFARSGLCAIRDTCTVLIFQGAEADLEEGSDRLKELRSQVEALRPKS